MIIGGLQTGNTRWLAAHLQNAADNESVELVETTGTIATDIDGALAEFDAVTAGTRAREGVYACFINPPEPLSRLQYAQALAHIEKRLDLTGQPRIVVFHVKLDKSGNPREHCHVVWSRIDTRAMKAIQLSHDRQKLRRCARELAAEFGVELPPGLANDRGAERFNDPPQPTRAEKAMEAASGLSRDERRRIITDCYRNSDSGDAFVNALEAAGFMLARGDKRVFVVVDIAGHVHSLARQIDGATTKDVKLRLEGLTLSLLPPASRAKVLMLQRAAAQQDAARADDKKKAQAKEAHERLRAIQRKRRAALDLLWQQMKIRQMHERKVLLAHIKAEKEHRIARRHWMATGLALYLRKIAVIRQLIEYYEKRRQRTMDEQHRALMEGLRRRHDNEAAELRRRYAALDRLERRESRTFSQRFGAYGDTDTDDLQPARPAAMSASYRASARLGPDSDLFAQNAADIGKRSASNFYAIVLENAADITAAARPRQEPADTLPPKINATIGFHRDYGAFRQNAADITEPVVNVSFVADDETARDNPGGHTGQPDFPAWPGAG